jgi:hypothetical protein
MNAMASLPRRRPYCTLCDDVDLTLTSSVAGDDSRLFRLQPNDIRSRRFGLRHIAQGSRDVLAFRYLRTGGVVLLQVGTAFVTPTEGQ